MVLSIIDYCVVENLRTMVLSRIDYGVVKNRLFCYRE